MDKERNGNGNTADISELGNAVCQVAQLYFKGRLSVVLLLKLACDLAVNGLVTDGCGFHYGVARTYNSSPEHLVFVKEVQRLALRLSVILGLGYLLGFRSLAVDNRLIHLDIAVGKDSVSRYLVARL